MTQTPDKWNAIITFCLAHSRRLQAFLPFKNNCSRTCLHSEDSQTTLPFPLNGGQENSSLSGEKGSYSTQKVGVYKLAECLPTALNEADQWTAVTVPC